MTDNLAALLILPFLGLLVLALECSRTGCTALSRRYRARRATSTAPVPMETEFNDLVPALETPLSR